MALSHIRETSISRSNKGGAVGSAAYIHRAKIHDVRNGVIHDYTKKGKENLFKYNETVHSNLLLPTQAKVWMKERKKLWNEIELVEDKIVTKNFYNNEFLLEKFKNSANTAQMIEAALPRELTLDQAKLVVEKYARKAFVERGFIVDYAIHWTDHNPHVHLLVVKRALEKDGTFSLKKERDLFSKAGLKFRRGVYEESLNLALMEIGSDARINFKSFADSGIDLIPSQKVGWYGRHIESIGGESWKVVTNDKIRLENIKNHNGATRKFNQSGGKRACCFYKRGCLSRGIKASKWGRSFI